MIELFSIGILCAATILLFVAVLRARKASAGLQKKYDLCAEENEQFVDEMERIKNELHLIRLKAGESDRLKAAFLCNMSHELRTPLHAIMGFAGLMSNPSLPEDDKITYANIINHNVDSLLEIISDIFDISQFESGDTEIVNEAVNVNELLNMLQTWVNLAKANAGKENIVVKTSKGNRVSDFCIHTDAYKLKRALSHLAFNALKYSSEGLIEIGYTFSKNNVIDFYVKDEGIGFEKDNLEIMLSQFRQVDETPYRQYGGLGLGLTLAQKFTHMISGSLSAESEPGKGSTFRISLPIISAQDAR